MTDITNIEETIRLAEAASKRSDWPEAIRYWQAILDYHGPGAPKKYHARLAHAHQAQNGEQAVKPKRLGFKALADVNKVIWVDPEQVVRKVFEVVDFTLYAGAILEGDWDLRTFTIEESPKYQSIVSHFVHGVAWDETDLFQKYYAKRLARGETVRGCTTLAEVKEHYQATIDPLYDDMKERGFILPVDEKGYITHIPHVHISRTGDLLYGRRGNHRLAIAKILRLERVPCMVRTRHMEWQGLRETLLESTPETIHTRLDPRLIHHPDLADIIDASLL